MQVISEILKLAEAQAAPMGLSVVEARFSQQGKKRTLEVTICRRGGRVSLTDCEDLSRSLERALDELTPPLIEGAYLLEVQSPGLERQLKSRREFEIFSGNQVLVKTKETIAPLGDCFTGILQSGDEGAVTILNPAFYSDQNSKSSKKKKKTGNEELQAPAQLKLELAKILQLRLFPSAPDESGVDEKESLEIT